MARAVRWWVTRRIGCSSHSSLPYLSSLSNKGGVYSPMIRWATSIFVTVLHRVTAAAIAAVLILGPSFLPTDWNDVPAALAKAGGNGKGNNGNGNGNGGPNGGHGNNGNGGDQGGAGNNGNGNGGDQGGSGNNGSSGKGKKDKTAGNSDQSSADSADAASQADQADQADQAGAAGSANQPAPAPAKRAAASPDAPGRAGHDFVADEVVVANIDGKVRTAIGRLGFVLLAERRLPSLDLTLARLRVPRAMTAPAARTLLASRFPGIEVDLN